MARNDKLKKIEKNCDSKVFSRNSFDGIFWPKNGVKKPAIETPHTKFWMTYKTFEIYNELSGKLTKNKMAQD